MIGLCPYDCNNKNEIGYCRNTGCVNPTYQQIDHHYDTIYGFKLQDLIKIAVILQSAGLSPDDATRALHDIDLIVDACRKEFFEALHITLSELL